MSDGDTTQNPAAHASHLMVLMFTDVEGSVDLKRQLGDSAVAKLITQHDNLFKQIIAATPGAQILKDVGDGFLARFATPSDAVNAALRFQFGLNNGDWQPQKLRVRIGLHLGEVTEMDHEVEGQRKILGLPADITARVMGLSQGGQILLTRAAFDAARQYVRTHPTIAGATAAPPPIRWMAYGRYLVKGVEEPVEIFEVGAEGIGPMKPPPDTDKARRAVAADEEETLGWRPAAGLSIPRRPGWALDRKLGEGGFGEVWLGRHIKTADPRVFKFCFDVEKLRSFRRELTLFRMIRHTLGDRKDIARLHEVQLESPPYFLESEFSEKGNLVDWASDIGGIAKVPLETRIDMAARVADAVAAAHSVGILHKDIKPQNILVQLAEDGTPRPILSDFGIGVVTDLQRLDKLAITQAGFTASDVSDNDSSRTGTRMYAPPEVLADRPFTVQGDIYALGILLFQLVIADLKKPLASGWERHVPDALLREDINVCVEGDPDRRLASAHELAVRLRGLAERRLRIEREAQAAARQAKRRRLVRVSIAAVVVLAAALTILTFALVRETSLRQRAERAEQRAESANGFLRSMLESVNADSGKAEDFSVRQLLDAAASSLDARFADQPEVRSDIQSTLGVSYHALGQFSDAYKQLAAAYETRKITLGPEHPDTLSAMHHLANALTMMNRAADALAMKRELVELRRRVLGAEHRDTLRSIDSLATSLYYGAEREEGEELRRDVLAVRRRVLGESDPDTLMSISALAQLALERKDLVEAEKLYRIVHQGRRSQLGEHHADTLTTAASLARVLSSKGDHSEAERMLSETVAALTKKLGGEHLQTLMARTTLATTILEQGRGADAELIARDCIRLLEKQMAPTHFSVMRAYAALGDALLRQAKIEEAETVCRRVLAGRQQSLQKGHRFIIESMRRLADVLHEAGKEDEAQQLSKEADELEKQAAIRASKAAK